MVWRRLILRHSMKKSSPRYPHPKPGSGNPLGYGPDLPPESARRWLWDCSSSTSHLGNFKSKENWLLTTRHDPPIVAFGTSRLPVIRQVGKLLRHTRSRSHGPVARL